MKTQHRHLRSMGTHLDMVFPGMESSHCDDIMIRVMAELARIEAKLSIFKSDSAISQINKMAHAGVVELDSELLSIFQDI